MQRIRNTKLKEGLALADLILQSDETSVKALAQISGYDLFSFFRGADLSGLDLSAQDLTGLNFDQASFQGSKLDGIRFDTGAFNNSIRTPEIEQYIDEFDCYLEDLLDPYLTNAYLFAKFRPHSLRNVMHIGAYSNYRLAELSNISRPTVSRARQSRIVSFNTAKSIALTLVGVDSDTEHQLFSNLPLSFHFHPMIALLSLRSEGEFVSVPRNDLLIQIDNMKQSGLDAVFFQKPWNPDDLRIYREMGMDSESS